MFYKHVNYTICNIQNHCIWIHCVTYYYWKHPQCQTQRHCCIFGSVLLLKFEWYNTLDRVINRINIHNLTAGKEKQLQSFSFRAYTAKRKSDAKPSYSHVSCTSMQRTALTFYKDDKFQERPRSDGVLRSELITYFNKKKNYMGYITEDLIWKERLGKMSLPLWNPELNKRTVVQPNKNPVLQDWRFFDMHICLYLVFL